MELAGDVQAVNPTRMKDLRDESEVLRQLSSEAGLPERDAALYLRLLRQGHLPISELEQVSLLLDRGMAIISGDGKRVIPVHPRLGIANYYRTWRDSMVREINERRMRVDRLILQLIPVYEAATKKKTPQGGG